MRLLQNRLVHNGGLAVVLALLLNACSAIKQPSKPLALSLQEIAPHGDRDHFVFLVEHPTDKGFQPAGLQVEHVSKLEQPGEFEVTLSEDGMATGRVQIRDDGKTLWLISEDDYSRGMRMIYDPPLPYLNSPLMPGEQRAQSTAIMRQLGNGQAAGKMQVEQVIEASAAPPGQWLAGVHNGGVQLHTTRKLQSAEGTIEMNTTMVLVPGIGEIRSEGGVSGAPTMRRELACAIVGNRSIGDCSRLFQKK